jgi:uncharacterized Fe-S center protein
MVNQAPMIYGSVLTDKDYEEGENEDKFGHIHPNTHWKTCLDHAESIGLGSQNYELVMVK